MAAQRLATVGCAFRATARREPWHGGRLGFDRLRRPGCASVVLRREPKAEQASAPITARPRTLAEPAPAPTSPG